MLADRIEALTEELLGAPLTKAPREWAFGRKNGSLKVTITGPKRGTWFDFAPYIGGGPLALIRHCLGLNRAEARTWSRDWLGGATVQAPPRTPKTAAVDDQIEKAHAIARAQTIARTTEPVPAPSQATRYLTGRGITVWPDSLGYTENPGSVPGAATGALVVPATEADGSLVATQRIFLRDGAQCPVRGPGNTFKAKRTNGRGGVWRLPGAVDGPLAIAEGPETALSVWQATGHETWCALGNLKRLASELPPGRTVIVAADGDDPDSPAGKALARVLEAADDGRRVRCAKPPVGSDWNDILQAEGDAAVRAGIDAAEVIAEGPPAPRHGAPIHDLEDARREARRAVESWLTEAYRYADNDRAAPPQHLIRITAGGGKSRIVRSVLAQRLSRYRFHARHQGNAVARAMTGGIVAVPTHELAREVANALHAQGISAVVWRGREHLDANGEAACGNLDAVADAQAAYAPIESTVCRQTLPNGEAIECPLYRVCAYQAQKPDAQAAEVVVITHASLFHEAPAALRGRSWMVIDESFTGNAARGGPGAALTLDALAERPAPGLTAEDHDRLAARRAQLAHALDAATDGPAPTITLADAGLTAADCRAAASLEWQLKADPELYPGQDATKRREIAHRAAQQNRLVDRRACVWKLLADALERELPAVGGIEIGRHETDAGSTRALIPRWHATIRASWPKAVLYLDATPRPDIARRHLPKLETVADLDVDAPNLHITQIPDVPHTRRKLDPTNQKRPRDRQRTNNALHKIQAFVQRKARDHDGGQVLVVAQEPIEEGLNAYRFRPNVEIRHFNELRGLDGFANYACLIVLGRPLPPAPEIETEAAALTNEVPVARPADDWWYDHVRTGIRRRDGAVSAIETPIHPDPTCETVRRQVCEDELVQVIGRLRGINRGSDNPAEVVLMNNLVLPVTLDALESWTTVAPDPTDLMLAHGVAVANATHAAQLRPDLWATRAAAGSALKRSRSHGTLDPTEPNDRVLGAVRGIYQRDARGAKAGAFLFDPTMVEEPAAVIEAAVGDLLFCDYELERPTQHRVRSAPKPVRRQSTANVQAQTASGARPGFAEAGPSSWCHDREIAGSFEAPPTPSPP